MHSDVKNLLRFTTLQTRLLMTIVACFFVITALFLVIYAHTEIRSRLSMAENGLHQRMAELDNSIQDFSKNVTYMRTMAELYLDGEGATDRANHAVGLTAPWPPGVEADPGFQKEREMAAHLYAIENAIATTERHIVRSYYYSKAYRFLSSHPDEQGNRAAPRDDLGAYLKMGRSEPLADPFWAGPFYDGDLGVPVVTHGVHLASGGEIVGALAIDISLNAFNTYTQPLFDDLGQVFVVTDRGVALASTRPAEAVPGEKQGVVLMDQLPQPLKPLAEDLVSSGWPGFRYQDGYLVFRQSGSVAPLSLIYLVSLRDFIGYVVPKMNVYGLSIFTAVVFFLVGIYVMVTRFVRPTRIAETALKKAHDELEVRVKERTTELSRINEELKESREKYRQLFSHAPAGIYEIDFVSGKFVSVNDVLCEYTGYSKEEFLDLSPFSLLTEKGKQILTERMKRVIRGESISRNVELDIINKDGTVFVAVLNNSFIYDGERITGSRVVIHDISDRKIAERALKKSEERFRNLVESTTDWIWDIDSKGHVIYSSPSVELITGYTPKDIQGRRIINYFPIYERERLYQTLMENILPGELLPTIECRIQHKNGEVRTLETRGVHYFDDMGQVLGVRGISRDITDKKNTESERMELQRTLSRAKKMEALGLLAGGVAHDLNNILSGIINYPELILMDSSVEGPLKDQVEAIYRSGKKAAAIVDDLITIARGAARKKEIVNINGVIDDYMQSAEYSSMAARYPEVRIDVTLDKDLKNTTTSSVQVRKALLNLVVNAVEAVQGQGRVSISSQNIELTSPIRGYDDVPPGDYVLLSVADTGGGISPEDMERIFEPFYSKKVMGRSGTGLGLAIVWNTVTEHGGHINVTSGRSGTVFDLYFPSTPFMETRAEPPKKIEQIRGKGQRVLVVDDEGVQREIATQLLSSLRYSSVALESGEKAVEYLKTEEVDVVLLDMVMEPGMNGRETYEKIIEINPAQKVVMTTGYADNREVKRAQEKGAGELLKKPYTLEELGRVISRQLGL